MNSLELSADRGALDVLHNAIGLRAQVCEIVLELVEGHLPGVPAVALRHTSGMAAWVDKKTELSLESLD